LSELIVRHGVGAVHYMRIFGGFNRRLVRRHPDVAFTITVPTFVDRGYPLHRLYHAFRNRTYGAYDRVIATTEATARALRDSGLAAPVEVIHWGTGTAPQLVMRHRPAGRDAPIQVLWAGPLQGTGRAEYAFALEVARRVTAHSDRFRFVFAFKPEKLTADLARLAADIAHCSVRETSKADFEQLRRHADLFLSPVCNGRRTVAPPLTWIEMMNSGVPVVATGVAGVDELVEHGRNGLVAESPDQAALLIDRCDRRTLERLGRAAADTVADRFSIERLTAAYCRTWDDLMQCKLRRARHGNAAARATRGLQGLDADDPRRSRGKE
jgi:glycosyltransferase involved in cell wall biosynthesis